MQFLVPQFIDVEPKLFGPISVRQFIMLAVSAALAYFFYSILIIYIAVPLMLIVVGLGFAFAFVKINSQWLHQYLLHFIRTFRKPRLKVWQKMLEPPPTRKPRREKGEEEKSVAGPAPQKMADTKNLGELALILDTGGTYRGEEELILPEQTAAVKPTKKSKLATKGGAKQPTK